MTEPIKIKIQVTKSGTSCPVEVEVERIPAPPADRLRGLLELQEQAQRRVQEASPEEPMTDYERNVRKSISAIDARRAAARARFHFEDPKPEPDPTRERIIQSARAHKQRAQALEAQNRELLAELEQAKKDIRDALAEIRGLQRRYT